MDLFQAIDHVRDLTSAMQVALNQDDPARALDLLPVRSLAMEKFQSAHRNASAAERAAAATKVHELQHLDKQLQEDVEIILMATAKAMHESPPPASPRAEPNPCLTSCLDRHA